MPPYSGLANRQLPLLHRVEHPQFLRDRPLCQLAAKRSFALENFLKL